MAARCRYQERNGRSLDFGHRRGPSPRVQSVRVPLLRLTLASCRKHSNFSSCARGAPFSHKQIVFYEPTSRHDTIESSVYISR